MAPQTKKPLDPVAKAELNRQGIEHWRRVGPLLEARRLAELRAMTAADRRRAVQAVMELARINPPTRTSSGLVEYYRKLRKLQKFKVLEAALLIGNSPA